MAGLALLRRSRPAVDGRGGKQFFDRLVGRRGRALATRRLLRHGDLVSGLGRLFRREEGAGRDVQREDEKAGAEHRAENLVELEGIHDGAGNVSSGAKMRRAALNSRFAAPLATRISGLAMAADTVVLIPARMASTRLPGKPLADIGGAPMIVHVMRRAAAAGIGVVVVATDSEAIAAAVNKEGGRAVLTRGDHASGSDRIFEALETIDPAGEARIVVNVQGDFPMLEASDIKAALVPLADPHVDIATIATEIDDRDERTDPNVVKAVGTPIAEGRLRALYFTRATAPHGEGPLYHHIGLYAFRREALARFVRLPPSPLEKREKLEQLRALEAGMRIDVMLVKSRLFGVDTPEQLDKARALLAGGS
jgi:3-deoxy-manno-octulosonate cytidylyltransferase (CMP-KDO synthetase)